MLLDMQDFAWTQVQAWRAWPGAGWLRLHYDQSLAAPLRRPVIRFKGDGGTRFSLGQAPLFGRGSWTGRVPRGTRSIAIAHGPEPELAYRVTAVSPLNLSMLLPRAFRRAPFLTWQALGAAMIGAESEHEQALGFARGGIALSNYNAWRNAHWRDAEPFGLDRALLAAASAVGFGILLPDATSQDDVSRLLAMLDDQLGSRWRLFIPEALMAPHRTDPRVSALGPATTLRDVVAQMKEQDLLVRLQPSDSLAPLALAQIATAAAARPETHLIYADEDARESDGRHHSVLLKPDWSPLFERHAPYIGHPAFWRVGALASFDHPFPLRDFDSAPFRIEHLERMPQGFVHHLRRVLLTRQQTPAPFSQAALQRHTPPEVRRPDNPEKVSIIIANKDRLTLLVPCIESILARSTYPDIEIIIVDNGSTDTAVLAYYRALEKRGQAVVLSSPGKFNFSLLSNLGARHAAGKWFIFLNNDMEVIAPDWIERLHHHAFKADVGAVGAQLIFPEGNLQHAGVIVGLGGYADHIHHSAPADAPGHLGRLLAPHELSATTGACLAVDAAKFWLVGGFDEKNLPVELNDIDLCLKLGTKGFKTIMEPQARLIHHQSASRGKALLPFSRYAVERSYFRNQWQELIRDDPYFHPALSIFALDPELDG